MALLVEASRRGGLAKHSMKRRSKRPPPAWEAILVSALRGLTPSAAGRLAEAVRIVAHCRDQDSAAVACRDAAAQVRAIEAVGQPAKH